MVALFQFKRMHATKPKYFNGACEHAVHCFIDQAENKTRKIYFKYVI